MSPRRFGQEEVSPGVVVELEKRWRVLSQKEEHEFQGSKQDDPRWSGPSYACIQLKVHQVGSRITPPVNGYMRIYKQIRTEETVADRPEVRAQHAKTVIPPELDAYRQLMDKGSTFTPRLLDSMEQKQDIYSFVPGSKVTSAKVVRNPF